MTYIKAVLLAQCVLSLLWVASPAMAQDTDTAVELISDTPTQTAAVSDTASEDAQVPADTEAPQGTDHPKLETPAGADASPVAPDENAAGDNRVTVEFAGPARRNASDITLRNPAGQSVTQLDAPPNLNPFIALGDEMFLGTAILTAWGIHFWDWFERSFHFEKEHGFTQQSSTGGADKTGHFFTAYVIADFLNWRLRRQGWPKLRSAIVGSSVAMGLMTWIEVGDGTSAYGWSWEDMLADFIGVAISAGLAMSSTADELFDFRMEYFPTKSYLKGGVMAADYSGMKYLMALRMTGIKPLKKTPLRLVEWHMGFYSRGFRSFDKSKNTNRVVYFGVGVDLKELFDKFIPKKFKRPFDVAFTYYQPPYTSWPMKEWEHKWSAPEATTPTPAVTSLLP